MKLFVTGGAGFIGSNFVRYILRAEPDWRVVNFDKLTYAGNLENLQDVEGDPRYRFIQGDIADDAQINKLLEEERFDAVVNFAAESHVDRSILDVAPFIQTNVLGTQRLLSAVHRHRIPRFVHISTDEVYGSIAEGHTARMRRFIRIIRILPARPPPICSARPITPPMERRSSSPGVPIIMALASFLKN